MIIEVELKPGEAIARRSDLVDKLRAQGTPYGIIEDIVKYISNGCLISIIFENAARVALNPESGDPVITAYDLRPLP